MSIVSLQTPASSISYTRSQIDNFLFIVITIFLPIFFETGSTCFPRAESCPRLQRKFDALSFKKVIFCISIYRAMTLNCCDRRFFWIDQYSRLRCIFQVAEGEKMLYSDEVIAIDPVVCTYMTLMLQTLEPLQSEKTMLSKHLGFACQAKFFYFAMSLTQFSQHSFLGTVLKRIEKHFLLVSIKHLTNRVLPRGQMREQVAW